MLLYLAVYLQDLCFSLRAEGHSKLMGWFPQLSELQNDTHTS